MLLPPAADYRAGQWTTCDAVLAYDSTRDKGRRPATISPGEYLQYEVRFKVASMSCRDGMHSYKTVSQ
ncbi:hypothetical protein GEV39_22365 [Pseudomonas sp. NY5710]|nr:hypothetical protein GEV39_22365 [Pseudomonas sp. NY5710]